MKKCSECSRILPMSALACGFCNEVLEDSFYLRIVWTSVALGGAIQAAIYFSGIDTDSPFRDAFMTVSFLTVLIYGLAKVIHALRDGQRPVLGEIESILSDRFYRSAITIIATVLILQPMIVLGIIGALTSQAPDNSIYEFFFVLRLAVIVLVVPLAFGFMLLRQGKTFLDLRISNTFLKRAERERSLSTYIVNGSYEDVFRAAGEVLESHGFSFEIADPAAGVVETESIRVPEEFCDRPDAARDTIRKAGNTDTSARVRIEIQEADDRKSSRITVRPSFFAVAWLDDPITFPCESKGVLESMVHREIEAAVRGLAAS